MSPGALSPRTTDAGGIDLFVRLSVSPGQRRRAEHEECEAECSNLAWVAARGSGRDGGRSPADRCCRRLGLDVRDHHFSPGALYDGSSFGDEAGDIDRYGFSTIRIDVTLKDPGSDGNSVHRRKNGWKPGQVRWFASLRPDICSTKTSSTLEAGAVGTLT